MTETLHQNRWIRVSKKLIIGVAMAFFLGLLGLFNGLGYHLWSLKEVSFVPYSELNFAGAVFSCDITYNPVIFPYYWLVGAGRLYGNFSHMYVAEAYSPGEYGGPLFGLKPQDRLDIYLMRMVTWGMTANIILLLSLTLSIEATGKRSLYLAFFGGTIGFAIASIIGAIVGLFVGAFLVAYILLKMPADHYLKRFWESLWE